MQSSRFLPFRAAWEILILVLAPLIVGVQPGIAHLHGEGNRATIAKVSSQAMLIVFGGLAVGTGVIIAAECSFCGHLGQAGFVCGQFLHAALSWRRLFSILTFSVSQIVLSLGAIRLSSVVQTVLNTVRIIAVAALLIPLGVLSVPAGAILALLLLGWLLVRNWQDIILHSRHIPWNGLLRGVRLLFSAGVVGWGGNILLHPTTFLQLALDAMAITGLMSILLFVLEPTLLEVAKQTLHVVRAR